MTVTPKTLGVLGGLSRVSTIRNHDTINREVLKLTGQRSAARLVTWSLDPETIIHLLSTEAWRSIGDEIRDAAANLRIEGVDGLMIASDTLHCVVEREAIHFPVPIVHVRDALVAEIRRLSLKRVGFIGTSVTMSGAYYSNLIGGSEGIEVVLPSDNLWINIDYSICNRIYNGESTVFEVETYNRIMSEFEAQGVDGIVVASPEIFLASNGANPVPVIHTARLHAQTAARWCVEDHDSLRPALPALDQVRPVPSLVAHAGSGAPGKKGFGKPDLGTFKSRGRPGTASTAPASATPG